MKWTLRRTGERITYEVNGAKVEGVRGELVIHGNGPAIEQLIFPTIERWGDYVSLVPGRYICECGWWTARSGQRRRAIRVVLTKEQFFWIYGRRDGVRPSELGRIYFHPANYPHELEGCIAPGLREVERGVSASRRAMDILFESLGGWSEGRRLEVEVA